MQTTTSSTLLRARHRSLDERFWAWWFHRTLKKSFASGHIRGLEHVAPWTNGSASAPLVFYCTHGSWWDAAVTMVVSLRVLRIRAYGMMEYKQLVRYGFFRRIGMFSVVREDPRSALESIRYAAFELNRVNGVLWMFPQGTLVHQEKLPIEGEPGVGILAGMIPNVLLCPVSIRYDFLREQRPHLRVNIGIPHAPVSENRRAVTQDCSSRLTELAQATQLAAMSEDEEGWTRFLRGRSSMEKRYDAWREILTLRQFKSK